MEKLLFKSNINELDNIFSKIEEALADYEISPKVNMQLNLAVEELFTNISKYAYEGEGIVELILDVINSDNLKIIIKLIDNGPEFNPLEQISPDISSDSSEREIGGLGIFLAKKNLDEISYKRENNQNVLTIAKFLN